MARPFVVLLVAIMTLRMAASQMMPSPPLDPMTVQSADGQYALWENPSDAGGRGEADYRLSMGAQVLWKKRLPFTCLRVAVANDGTIGGYGAADDDARHPAFFITLLKSDGSVRRTYREGYAALQPLDAPLEPNLWSVHIDEAVNRLVVCIRAAFLTGGRETWRCYRLSDGNRTENEYPESPKKTTIVAAAAVPDTPFTLVNWYSGGDTPGGGFGLVDTTGKLKWRLDLPKDYTVKGNPEAEGRLQQDLWWYGAILGTGRGGEFEVRFTKSGHRVKFRVDPKSGRVREVSRRLFTVSVPARIDITRVPTIALKGEGKFLFQLRPGAESPIHDVYDFCFLSNGNIVILRGGESGSVVEIDQTGKLIRQVSLPFKFNSRPPLVRIDDDRVLVFDSAEKTAGISTVWAVDLKSGRVSALRKFPSTLFGAAVADPKSGFAVEYSRFANSSMTESVSSFDRDGNERWTTDTAGVGDNLTMDSAGRLITTDPVSHLVQYFDPRGKPLLTLDLAHVVGKPLSYTSWICSAPDGGVVIEDSGTLYRLSPNGTLKETLPVRLANGDFFLQEGPQQVDSANQIWVSNGKALMQLGKNGRPIQTIGTPPGAIEFTSVSSLTVDRHGNVFAVNSANGDMLSFDHSGKLRFDAKPAPGEISQPPVDFAAINLSASGDVYVDYRTSRRGEDYGVIHYSATGKRVGFQKIDERATGPVRESVGADWRWHERLLLDGSGRVMATLDRWPDLKWLDSVPWEPMMIAPNGEFATYSRKFDGYQFHPYRLGFYAANGQPLSMSEAPATIVDRAKTSAYDGRYLYFTDDKSVFVVDRRGKPIGKFPLPFVPNLKAQILPWDGGLGLFDGKATIYWYAKPGNKT